ncbi:MAG: translation initiation factor IF-2 [Mycoplasmoidaceae bacterium]
MKKTMFKKKNVKGKKFPAKKVDNRKNIDIKTSIKSVKTGINQQGIFIFTKQLTPDKFAEKLSRSPQEIIKYFFMKGQLVVLNNLLTVEQMGEYCLECGYDYKWEEEINQTNFLDKVDHYFVGLETKKRPPVITIMGHVNHGKTTLLDFIKNSKIVDKEFGGITQHIGAYSIGDGDNMITLIDTPGHEAFTHMRKRGASVTDIVVIVVAVDDGIMPQTQEAIDHAKAANTKIIVFINKMDKYGSDPEKVMGQLAECGLSPEEWGGDTIFIKGSAKTGLGVDELKESILLVAELMDLRAAYDAVATGTVIESNMDRGLGPVANILIKNGTLNLGDFVIIGNCYGKIRRIINDIGKDIKAANPSMPVLICGLNNTPESGDKFLVVKDEKTAKNMISLKIKEQGQKPFNQIFTDSDGKKTLNIIIKCDVNGSIQAINSILDKIKVDGTILNIVRTATGNVSESDISLAKVTDSIIYGFNTTVNKQTINYAKSEDIMIKLHNVIYQMKEEIESIMIGILDPIFEEKINGKGVVQQTWNHSDIGQIAGCLINEGEFQRNSFVRVLRENKIIIEKAKITSLKHEKNSISKIAAGKECGLTLENFNDFVIGDKLEFYSLEKKMTGKL